MDSTNDVWGMHKDRRFNKELQEETSETDKPKTFVEALKGLQRKFEDAVGR